MKDSNSVKEEMKEVQSEEGETRREKTRRHDKNACVVIVTLCMMKKQDRYSAAAAPQRLAKQKAYS